MKYIIIIIASFLFSCTSSGKLSDAKFPYKRYHLTVNYTPEPGTILNVGTYTLTPIIDVPCIDCMVAEMHLKVVEIIAAFFILCYIGIFIHDWWIKRKDKVVTLPDEFNQNY